jgi:predicted TIM-barrel fold metal-dependent hydrolase
MKIDIFCHITPPKFLKVFEKKVSPQICSKLPYKHLPSLVDMDTRFRIMDRYKDVVQVLTLTNPPIELVTEPIVACELAKVVNDEMAEMVMKYPDRFVGAVACLPLNDLDATLKETDRAIKDLHFKGVQIYSHIMGKPLDSPEFTPLYEKMAQYDLPIWIHPFFQSIGVFTGQEDRAWAMDRAAFGITSGTTTAMTRLVYSHVFDNYPNIKFITHHCGSSVPYFANRIQMHYDMFAARERVEQDFHKPVLEYYKMFYADTALHGNVPAMMCGYNFFGTEHILFGTDMPFDAEHGLWTLRKTVESIEQMEITDLERKKIFEDNTRRLLRI